MSQNKKEKYKLQPKILVKDNMIAVYLQALNNKLVWCGSFSPMQYNNDALINLLVRI